jgi:hypothetical protein
VPFSARLDRSGNSARFAIWVKMPTMFNAWFPLRRPLLVCLVALALCTSLRLFAEDQTPPPSGSLEALADDFWQWRAQYQPFSRDDIPRIERPLERSAGHRDWSASSIAKQKEALEDVERRWKQIDPKAKSVARQVDYRLMGSALARVRWELDINPRWQRDPSFYLDQTLTALLEALVEPPPFDPQRSREIVDRMEDIPKIIEDGKANLKAVRPFAQLAIGDLQQIRPELERVGREVAPLLHGSAAENKTLAAEFTAATEKAIVALEAYRAWLQAHLDAMPDNAAVGRENYEFFLHHVALLPYSPEQLLAVSRQEWDRSLVLRPHK